MYVDACLSAYRCSRLVNYFFQEEVISWSMYHGIIDRLIEFGYENQVTEVRERGQKRHNSALFLFSPLDSLRPSRGLSCEPISWFFKYHNPQNTYSGRRCVELA